LDVGTDIALSNTIAREIIHAGLHHREFIKNATVCFEAYAESVEEWTLERGQMVTGVPADAIQELAHTFACADKAQICWTLGITEHHNAVDNVLSLINLGLLCGHVGRWGSGLAPLRGQNNVQGGGDMGAIPNKLAGFQDIEKDAAARAKFESAWGTPIIPKYGWHLTQMFEAMERKELTTLFVIGENPAQSEADISHTRHLLEGLEFMVVQDILFTKTAQMADVVLPASASWCESEGTVTNSERRVQRVRKALDPPGNARDDMAILQDIANRLGAGWNYGSTSLELAENIWNEVRSLSPMHAGMSYKRLEELGGIQWPCVDENDPGMPFLHGRLWETDEEKKGMRAPFSVVIDDPPVDLLDEDFPLRLTTGRRLDSYNTGVQTGEFASPLRNKESIDLSPEDGAYYGVSEGEQVRVISRRGCVEAPVKIDTALRPGLVFMTMHFPDEVDVNKLTIEATDPRSGTAEFKATAVRIEKLNGTSNGKSNGKSNGHTNGHSSSH
jgi:formate dehydrogenase major subunit